MSRVDDNSFLYLMTRAGGLFSVDLLWSPANNYVYKTSLYNHLADSYIKNNELEAAETI